MVRLYFERRSKERNFFSRNPPVSTVKPSEAKDALSYHVELHSVLIIFGEKKWNFMIVGLDWGPLEDIEIFVIEPEKKFNRLIVATKP